MSKPRTQGELVLYETEDGSAKFFLRAKEGSVWLTQIELAKLFETTVPNINIHVKNVLDEGELNEIRTIKEDLIVQFEGARKKSKSSK